MFRTCADARANDQCSGRGRCRYLQASLEHRKVSLPCRIEEAGSKEASDEGVCSPQAEEHTQALSPHHLCRPSLRNTPCSFAPLLYVCPLITTACRTPLWTCARDLVSSSACPDAFLDVALSSAPSCWVQLAKSASWPGISAWQLLYREGHLAWQFQDLAHVQPPEEIDDLASERLTAVTCHGKLYHLILTLLPYGER